jgi:hypothetical protein
MMVTQILTGPARPAERTWPAIALTIGIGVFSAIALGAVATKPVRGAAFTWLLLGGLWGAAAVQICCPAAELVIKLLVLTGLLGPASLGAHPQLAHRLVQPRDDHRDLGGARWADGDGGGGVPAADAGAAAVGGARRARRALLCSCWDC